MRIKLYDPRTGNELLPLFVMKNGHAVYPVLGASSDDPSNDDASGDDEDEDDEEEDDQDDKGDDSGDTGKEKDKKPETVDRAEYLRLKKRLQAADRRASGFEAQLRELTNAGKPELEKLQAELDEAKKDREETALALNTTRLENAVLKDTQFSWNDPEDVVEQALKALRKGDLEISDDGEVEGVTAWLKELAKRKPHYLKAEKKRTKDDDDDDAGPTGGSVGSGKKKKTKGMPESELRRILPALNR